MTLFEFLSELSDQILTLTDNYLPPVVFGKLSF